MPNQNVNAYAYGVNAQNGSRHVFTNGENQSPFANLGGPTQYNPQAPAMFPTVPNVAPGQSFSALPFPQNTMISDHLPLQKPGVDSSNHSQPYQAGEDGKIRTATSESELEDGELSSEAMSEAEDSNETQTKINQIHNLCFKPHTTEELHSGLDHLEAAQNLVRELHSWGLSFQEIVNEVTDGQALQRIFQEMGLPLDSKEEDITPSQGLSFPKNASETQQNPCKRTTNIAKTDSPKPLEATRNAAVETTLSQDSVAEPAVNEVNITNNAKTLDRKVLIAQKLAAKNVRSASSPSIPAATSEPKAGPPHSANEGSPLLKQSAPDTMSLPLRVDISPSVPSQPFVEAQSELEAKRKTNAELARQKMEALKQKVVSNDGLPKPAQSSLQGEVQDKAQTETLSNEGGDETRSRSDFDVTAPKPTKIGAEPAQLRTNATDVPRKESYFSPVSQKPMFAIPGLFSMPERSAVESPHHMDHATETVESQPLQEAVPEAALTKPQMQQTSSSSPLDHSNASAETAPLGPRIRQKATDFIESPPRPKRPLTQQDTGVVIDISDEESVSSGEIEYSKDDGPEDEEGLKQRRNNAAEIIDHRSDNSANASNDSRSSRVSVFAMADPSVTETTTIKPQELKGYQTKVMEIESMNRKIAELEANIKARKAKQAASSAQSPRSSSLVTALQTPMDVSSIDVDMPTGRQEKPFVGSDKGISSSKEAEISDGLAANTMDGEPESQDLSDKKAHEEEGNNLHPSMKSVTSEEGEIFDQLGSAASPPYSAAPFERGQSEEPESLEAQQQARRAEIESGLPMLEKEIDQTRNRLKMLKQQEAELEVELRKGMQGRQILLDELRRLSQTVRTLDVSEARTSIEDHDQLAKASKADHNTPTEEHNIGQEATGYVTQAYKVDDNPEGLSGNPPLTDTSVPPIQPAFGQPSPEIEDLPLGDVELEEDVMDISRSDIEEGEVTDGFVDTHFDILDSNFGRDDPYAAQDQLDSEGDDNQRPATDFDDHQSMNLVDGDARDQVSPSNAGVQEADEAMTDALDFENDEAYEPPNDISQLDNISIAESMDHVENDIQAPPGQPLESKSPDNMNDGDSLFDADDDADTISPVTREIGTDDGLADQQIVTDAQSQKPGTSDDTRSEADYEPPEPTVPSSDSNSLGTTVPVRPELQTSSSEFNGSEVGGQASGANGSD